MLFILSLVSIPIGLFLLSILLKIEFDKRNPFIFLWITVALIFWMPSWFDIFKGNFTIEYREISRVIDLETIILAQFYSYIGALLYIVGYFLIEFLWRTKKVNFEQINSVSQSAKLLPLISGLLITWAASTYLIITYGLAVFSFGFTDVRSTIPYAVTFLIQALPKFYIGYILYFIYKNNHLKATLLTLSLLAIFLSIGGTRQNIIQIGVCVIVYAIVYWVATLKRKIVTIFTTASVGVILLGLMLTLRNTVGLESRLELISSLDLATMIELIELKDANLRGVYYSFIEDYKYVDFWQLQYFLRTLLFWLPSSLSMGIKPDDFEYTMFKAFTGDDATMHPTFFGSVFADSGPFLPLWIAFILLTRQFVQACIAQLRGSYFAASYVACAMSCIMLGRGAIYSAILILIASSAMYWIFQKYQKN